MCCCGKPVINGELGYRWQPEHAPSVRPANPPDLQDGDVLLYDEPGRCGGIDSHAHHFRVVNDRGAFYLLVRHGGGDERHRFGWGKTALSRALESLDSNGRYWLLCAAYHAISEAASNARHSEHSRWTHAVAEKRVKVSRRRGVCRVEIVPKIMEVPHGNR